MAPILARTWVVLLAVALLSGVEPRDIWAAEPPAANAPLEVCLVSGSLEYKSDESLADFESWASARYDIRFTRAFRHTDDDLPGLEHLATCDVMLLFTRRLTISGDQLRKVKDYCQSGRPIVGVRTASHAFQNWLDLDREILGGNYKGHYGEGPQCEIHLTEAGGKHPILKGVDLSPSPGSLYKNTGLADDVEVLLEGSIPEHKEPIAWTRKYKDGRLFYTSLGHPGDFESDAFKEMLTNALYWTAGQTPRPKEKKK
jgi:type 1 glutamine amidotransferase